MAINFEAKQQILFDSFNMFKDDWDSNHETLKTTIAKIATTDVPTALQMWTYLLTKHSRKIKTDSEITSGILDKLPVDSYDEILNNSFIVEKLFLKACDPCDSMSFVIHFLEKPDYATTAKLLEMISKNTTVAEYNSTDYKSSNLSTSLYYLLEDMSDFGDNDMEFLSEWIERVSDIGEKTKLKVLMISKESTVSNTYTATTNTRRKNDYLLEGATLEELDMASSRREDFEIKKLIEKICNNTIDDIDFSRLDVNWVSNVFRGQNNYSEENFNLIGAYLWINSLSWESKRIIQDVYKNKLSIQQIVRNSYNGDSEITIKKRIDLVNNEISKNPVIWNFNCISSNCEKIASLFNGYKKFLHELSETQTDRLSSHVNTSISDFQLNGRINNLLKQHGILTLVQLVDYLNSGIHYEGLGEKSVNTLKEKVEGLGIQLASLNEDISFIYSYLGIERVIEITPNTNEILKDLNLPYGTFPWSYGRFDIRSFLEKQAGIASKLSSVFFNQNQSLIQNMKNLRNDNASIYIPCQYFFREINIKATHFA